MEQINDADVTLYYLSLFCLEDFREMRLTSGIFCIEMCKALVPHVPKASLLWPLIDINLAHVYDEIEKL